MIVYSSVSYVLSRYVTHADQISKNEMVRDLRRKVPRCHDRGQFSVVESPRDAGQICEKEEKKAGAQRRWQDINNFEQFHAYTNVNYREQH